MGRVFVAAAVVLLVSAGAFAASDEYVRVDVQGVLHSQPRQQAFVDANGVSYKLNIGNNPSLANMLPGLNGQPVLISGDLFIRQDNMRNPQFEVSVNRIVDVRANNVVYDRSSVQFQQQPEQVQEGQRPVIIEKENKPIFKAGPLEINP